MSDWIEIGKKAPAFSLPDASGKKVKLSDFKGSPVIIYFYPRDDTPGCTQEACDFRDRSAELSNLGAVVIGISADSVESHQRFHNKLNLNFPLLSDPAHKTIEKYGAWREKNMYGKKSMGIQRSTYLIDANGKVAQVWKRAIVANHAEQVLEELLKLK